MRSERAASSDERGADSTIGTGRDRALLHLLTLPEVAELLRVSDKTVRRWMLSKRLPHVRLGRVVRFRQDELLRWIEARKEV
jgi:excisionase family DNA binding protein